MFLTFNVQKIKSMDGVRAASNHNLRLGNFGKNVDSDLTKDNLSVGIGDATPYDSIKRLWKEVGEQREQLGVKKLREDTNRAVEIIVGASSEFFEDLTRKQKVEFFQDQLAWLQKEYADKGQLVSAVVHFDEPAAAPHLQAIFAPIIKKSASIGKGKEVMAPTFSAKEMLGNPDDLRDARTRQHLALGKKWGLARGKQYTESTDPEQVKQDKLKLKEFKAARDEAVEMLKHFDIDALRQTALHYAAHLKPNKSKAAVMNKIEKAFAQNDKDALASIIVKNQNKPK